LSGRGLCNKLITRPEESYRLWRVVVGDLETSWMRRPWPTGIVAPKTKQNLLVLQGKAQLTLNYVDFCDVLRHFRLWKPETG